MPRALAALIRRAGWTTQRYPALAGAVGLAVISSCAGAGDLAASDSPMVAVVAPTTQPAQPESPTAPHQRTTVSAPETPPLDTVNHPTLPLRTVEPVEPVVIDCSTINIIVLGNSIEISPGVTPADRDFAWPALLEHELNQNPLLENVRVKNESALGATMTLPNYFGDEDHMRMITHLPGLLDGLDAEQRSSTIVLVVPSIIELNFNGGDTERAVESVRTIVELLEESGIGFALVLPMHPQAPNTDDELNKLIAEFNDALEGEGVTDPMLSESPLLESSTIHGSPQYYDDFKTDMADDIDDRGDGVHPDRDGHQRLAHSIAPLVFEAISGIANA